MKTPYRTTEEECVKITLAEVLSLLEKRAEILPETVDLSK